MAINQGLLEFHNTVVKLVNADEQELRTLHINDKVKLEANLILGWIRRAINVMRSGVIKNSEECLIEWLNSRNFTFNWTALLELKLQG